MVRGCLDPFTACRLQAIHFLFAHIHEFFYFLRDKCARIFVQRENLIALLDLINSDIFPLRLAEALSEGGIILRIRIRPANFEL